MSEQDRNSPDIQDELLRRLEAGGEMGELMRAFGPLVESELAREFVRLLGVDPDEIREPLAEAEQLLGMMESAIARFAPLGWAPSAHLPADLYSDALDVYRRTGSTDEAENRLVEGWNAKDRLRLSSVFRMRSLGSGHGPLHEIFLRRAELVERALKHHTSGAYEASLPVVLAQIDGIVWDLTDPPVGFFSGKRADEQLADDITVAGLPQGLALLRKLFSQGMWESGMTGRLSRHAILHGRELGYDTCINSTKAFVLLVAVIELAEPRARELAERLEREREERYAGSHETDEHGRRVDTRGFKVSKESLQRLSNIQMGQWRNHGRYGSNLDVMAPGDLGDEMLHGKSDIVLNVSRDGREFWAWRSTPSGFCFGIAGRDGPPHTWCYAGMKPPSGGVDEDDWRGLDELPDPNWN